MRTAALSALAAQNPDPRARLRAIIELAVGVLAGPQSQSWVLRVIGREAITPSPAFERLLLEPEGLLGLWHRLKNSLAARQSGAKSTTAPR